VRRGKLEDLKTQLEQLNQKSQRLKDAMDLRNRLEKEAQGVIQLSENRFYWIKLLAETRRVMMQAEASVQPGLKNPE